MAADTSARGRALQRWVDIATTMKKKPPKGETWASYIRDTMEPKSTATLLSLASSWAVYFAWCRKVGRQPEPLEEETVVAYLRAASAEAPTRAKKFMEAVGFAGYHLEFKVDQVYTPRTRGLAMRGLKRKRDTVQKSPFTVAQVTSWEDGVVATAAKGGGANKEDIARGVLTGFFLWLVHARARFGDAARLVAEPTLEGVGERGFLECAAKFGQHKTGHAAKKAGRIFPMTALSRGIDGVPWASAWLQLRARAGLNAEKDDSLQPELLMDWMFGAGRMTT